MNMQDQVGTILLLVLSVLYLIYSLAPFNWKYIPNRWAGVIIRFGRVIREVHGEGPIHIWWPFERLVRIPMFDLQVPVPLANLVTGAPNPQNVSIKLALVLRFNDPIAVILSVPDRDPIDEFISFVRAAARAGVQGMSIEDLAVKNSGITLSRYIKEQLEQEELLARWGLMIVSLKVTDIDLSGAYLRAQSDVIAAEGSARATRIRADAQTEAANRIGQADSKGVAAVLFTEMQNAYRDMAKAGGLRTWVQAGGDALKDIFKILGGGS